MPTAAASWSFCQPIDGDRHGAVEDPAGNLWWVATHVEDVPAGEMRRRAEALRRRA